MYIIKLEELNASPLGECYCSNGTKRRWRTGECDVYLGKYFPERQLLWIGLSG
jgi:hypothetical protein